MTIDKDRAAVDQLVAQIKEFGLDWFVKKQYATEGREKLFSKARAKYRREVYKYFTEGIEGFLTNFGFSKYMYRHWLAPTFYGWAAIHVGPTGQDSYIKLIVTRTFKTLSFEELKSHLKSEKYLPLMDYFRELRTLVPTEELDKCFDVLHDWPMRQARLSCLTYWIERVAFPIFRIPAGDDMAKFEKACGVIAKETTDETYDLSRGSFQERCFKLLDEYRMPEGNWDFTKP